MGKPASLSHVPDSKWSEFQSKVDQEARAIWRQDLVWFLALPIFAVFQFLIPRHVLGPSMLMALGLLPFALALGGMFCLVHMNQQHDNAISQAAMDFSKHLGGGSLIYFTEYTGVCKPK